MAIYHNFEATTEEIGEVLRCLQTFDPPGVGASDLRECLLLQVERKKDLRMREVLTKIIGNYFDDLLKNHWEKLQLVLHLTDEEKVAARQEIRKLNPRPGSALGEVMGFKIHQITPDFIVETNDDGRVVFTLNRGHMPALEVSQSYIESLDSMKNLSKREKEAIPTLRRDIDKAKGLIDAIQQRQETLKKTMAAIIRRQERFFIDGDEADLRPMTLKDVASDTGLAISTISRVTNEKYAETHWGIFRLRFFFTDKIDIDGEEVSTRKLKILLQEIIDKEDKSHPLTDMQIEQEMKQKGFPIARRTIVKYREQLGIPKSTLRRQ
jgi:RNA polymerase sigma-54 factor